LVSPDHEVTLGADEVAVGGSLGSQLLLWEYATAVAGRLLGVNPFDQPDVEAAKAAARGLLDERPEAMLPDFTDGAVQVRGSGLAMGSSLDDALRDLLGKLGPDGYLSVQTYLDRFGQAELERIRPLLAEATGRPVTFGWGPRFLHSTGQFHKGGPATGVYLQLTGEAAADVPIPGRPFSFGELIDAQAAGDANVLREAGRPVLRLHLADRAAGLRQVIDAVSRLAGK
jgi:glucose-6-phosphate isomerase